MSAKIVTFFLILIINVAIGAALFFVMLLALNGFSERAANYAFSVFIGGGLLTSLLMAAGGFLLVGFLAKKNWKPFSSGALAVGLFAVLGLIVKLVIFFAGVLIADFVRTAR